MMLKGLGQYQVTSTNNGVKMTPRGGLTTSERGLGSSMSMTRREVTAAATGTSNCGPGASGGGGGFGISGGGC